MPKYIEFVSWNAGAAVLDPDRHIDPDDHDTPLNRISIPTSRFVTASAGDDVSPAVVSGVCASSCCVSTLAILL
jgi:hypothetical protein